MRMMETVDVIIGAIIVVINSFSMYTRKSANLMITIILSIILIALLAMLKGRF